MADAMKKKRKRVKANKKQKRLRRRGPRVRAHKGPLQIELPLQMPLFVDSLPTAPDGDGASSVPVDAPHNNDAGV
jgi:hypothetical protein